MIIILSQKIDSESSYSDDVFKIYHYPSRYRNQIHVGDTFVYYQGNRYKKEERYYFGTGTIESIYKGEDNDYYAVLTNCKKFDNNVSIYLADGGYIEQLDYQTVRKSINPPWQSSIRPLSEKAFRHILSHMIKQSNMRNGLDWKQIGCSFYFDYLRERNKG